ncbi:leucine carboxyl methyltransferase [Vararia minispora EC-137]|uniref:Leucine carboxyl methyltransferase n=1 Tax=Vararia minispora EC-137 TaxID=1314806 RepID=A0ACB8QW56_9AGAM|nr:leucine carboxyl methyltransferase [Vararia minispora EC-137]
MDPPTPPLFRDPLASPSSKALDLDEPVRATDNDAALARLSAVRKGYLVDPFIIHFVPRAHLQPPRPPLINIGTYIRGTGLDELVESFIGLATGQGKKAQIVSLGAGSDTRFWRLHAGTSREHLACYIELDFPENTTRKAMAVRKSKVLSAALGRSEDIQIGDGGTSLHSSIYRLLPLDLRLPPSVSLAPKLAPILDPSSPLLILCECVLAYVASAASDAVLRWFADFSSSNDGVTGVIIYEMFGLEDSFGRVMKNNLKSRHVELPGAEPYNSLDSLRQRFFRLGFEEARALTLRDFRRTHISVTEQMRIARIEMLDEVEELELVLQHYAISWGIKLSAKQANAWLEWGIAEKSDEDWIP